MKKDAIKMIKKSVETYIFEIKGFDKNNHVCYLSYEFGVHNKYLTTVRQFKALQEARDYKFLALNLINKTRINRLSKGIEKDLLDYPETALVRLGIKPEDYANYYTEIVPNFDENFEKARNVLNCREDYVFTAYFKDNIPLNEIRKKYGVCYQATLNILKKAIKKLSHFGVKNIFIQGKDKYELINKEERDRLIEEVKKELTIETAYKIIKEYEEKTEQGRKKREEEQTLKTDVVDLDLSARSYNCLKRANINTVGELIGRTEDEIMKVRNLGKKSFKEIREKLYSMGLNFREYRWGE